MYLTPEQERRNAIDYRPHARSQNARQRVERLEKTVNQLRGQMRTVELTSNRAYGSLTLPSDPSQGSTSAVNQPDRQLTENMGKLNMTGDYAVYTGSTHWITILEDVNAPRISAWIEMMTSSSDPEPQRRTCFRRRAGSFSEFTAPSRS